MNLCIFTDSDIAHKHLTSLRIDWIEPFCLGSFGDLSRLPLLPPPQSHSPLIFPNISNLYSSASLLLIVSDSCQPVLFPLPLFRSISFMPPPPRSPFHKPLSCFSHVEYLWTSLLIFIPTLLTY
jgi:hypothetical protein